MDKLNSERVNQTLHHDDREVVVMVKDQAHQCFFTGDPDENLTHYAKGVHDALSWLIDGKAIPVIVDDGNYDDKFASDHPNGDVDDDSEEEEEEDEMSWEDDDEEDEEEEDEEGDEDEDDQD